MRVEIKGDTAYAHDGDRYLGMVRKDPCGGPYSTRDLALAARGYSRAVAR